ncbi:hypothetical protein HN385_02735 [archaeon]|jgi:hypothetical protein|nr:hypothetical protein [archaeon]MBT3450667.1 hypothetical protein [archaeon]MBT6868753.1 hypothetical protein [archaeon]MBT7193026.1 hypothetical protein [archaeon]MBT7380992.1 hypothetical protein [archaeon]
MQQGWIIQHNLPQRYEPNGFVEGREIRSSDLDFVNKLLREFQVEGNLVRDVTFVMEFTPTVLSHNKAYCDRSNIALSYDTDKFRFEFNPLNAFCEPEERIQNLARIVNAWTGNEVDLSLKLSDLQEKFGQLRTSTNKFHASMVGVLGKNYTRQDLLEVYQQNFKKLESDGFVLGQYFHTYLARLESGGGNYDDYIPSEIGIPLKVGSLNVNCFYNVLNYDSSIRSKIKTSLKENIDFHDSHYVAEGKLLESKQINFSLESIHQAGFKGIRDIYWMVPKLRGHLGSGFHQRRFENYPKVSFNDLVSQMGACGNFDISKSEKDYDFFDKLRVHFGLNEKTERIPCNASIMAGFY